MSENVAELIRHMGAELGGKIEALRGDFGNQTEALRGDFGNQIEALRGDFGNQIEALRGDFGNQIEALRGDFGGKIDALGNRLELVEREQARLRVDLMAQTERILNEQTAIRTEMRIIVLRVDRLDATVNLALPELRAMHDAFHRMSERVRKLEDGNSGT